MESQLSRVFRGQISWLFRTRFFDIVTWTTLLRYQKTLFELKSNPYSYSHRFKSLRSLSKCRPHLKTAILSLRALTPTNPSFIILMGLILIGCNTNVYKRYHETAHNECGDLPSTVWDVTWLSGQSMHLAKWMHALEQVTAWHLVKWPHQLTTWSSAIQYLDILTHFLL